MNDIAEKWRGGLIVSCQAPAESPLAKPEIIAALAATAEMNGAVGVRIDAPENITAVKKSVSVPVLGIYKVVTAHSSVYISPTFTDVLAVAAAGADVIALDATRRPRPLNEQYAEIVRRIKSELQVPIMADVAEFEDGIYSAEEMGVDFVSTTLSGYTEKTKHLTEPDFTLVERLAQRISVPVICEGRLRTPEDVRNAFNCGAHAVVVGNAITGVDLQVRRFAAQTKRHLEALSAKEFYLGQDGK